MLYYIIISIVAIFLTSILRIDNHLKNKIYLCSFLVALSLLLVPNNVLAISTKYKNLQNFEYNINRYDINIVVNENNTLKITEQIGAYFNIDKHGIFRKIPLRNTIERLDGTTSRNNAKITEINVNEKHTVYNESGYKVIKIGDPNYTKIGQQNYTISYLYNLGKDPRKDIDELYFNLIGNEWDTSISNITFTIIMPKSFDASKLGFSSGPKGVTDSSNIIYRVNGNIITGNLNKTLNIGEALTIRLELPEGYFINTSNNMDVTMILSPIITILFIIIAYILWKKYGQDEKVVETVEFYPPENLNSLEIGSIYKGVANSKDVTSLLIYLANKGYIKITEIEEKRLFSKTKEFKITKLKEYDGNNINEYTFFNGLFQNNINEVTTIDLYDKFYLTTRKIIKNVNSKENRKQIFDEIAFKKTKILIIMFFVIYVLISTRPIGEIVPTENPFAGYIFMLFTFAIGFIIMIFVIPNNKTNQSLILGIILCLFWTTPWIIVIYPHILIFPIQYTISLIGLIILLIFIYNMDKRTIYGNEMLGKIKGFKNFLETAEKDKLESLVMENPSYFYNILPYTYVLGVSDKWIKKFETITVTPPSWYDSSSDFDMHTFSSFMNSTMQSVEQSMSSSSSSSSGGGSSGGGSGGGGGGSW